MRLSKSIALLCILLGLASSAWGDTPSSPAPLLPDKIGKFRKIKTVDESSSPQQSVQSAGDGAQSAIEQAEYRGSNGGVVLVVMDRSRQDAKAYEGLSVVASTLREKVPSVSIGKEVGTASFAADPIIAFCKGRDFVTIKTLRGSPNLKELAQTLSDTLDKGEGEIPVLIKHLPYAEETQKNAVYLNSFAGLGNLPLQHPVLEAIQSGGNADAVLASYGPSKILIVEFNTPQLASENDQRIIARIQELWKLGQPAPTAYRRVGNYSVMVFDAPDEQTAKQLIDQVKYEQVVQWLGDNPNILKEAQKRYVNTTLGVLVTVLKASGYALITCLGMGGLIGGLLFSYRRSQQKDVTAFSDAGGMLRLNLDEMTGETNPSRLLRERN